MTVRLAQGCHPLNEGRRHEIDGARFACDRTEAGDWGRIRTKRERERERRRERREREIRIERYIYILHTEGWIDPHVMAVQRFKGQVGETSSKRNHKSEACMCVIICAKVSSHITVALHTNLQARGKVRTID